VSILSLFLEETKQGQQTQEHSVVESIEEPFVEEPPIRKLEDPFECDQVPFPHVVSMPEHQDEDVMIPINDMKEDESIEDEEIVNTQVKTVTKDKIIKKSSKYKYLSN